MRHLSDGESKLLILIFGVSGNQNRNPKIISGHPSGLSAISRRGSK